MAAQTQTVVFMKILLIQAWSVPGISGSFSGCGVFCLEEQLTKGGVDASPSARGSGGGEEASGPSPSQRCGASPGSTLGSHSGAQSEVGGCFFFDSEAGWVWVRWESERPGGGDQKPCFRLFCG